MNLWLLHGFLGAPDDWNAFIEPLEKKWSSLHSVSWDLNFVLSQLQRPRKKEMMEYFLERAEVEKPFLIGYSLGGRLGMELVRRRERAFKGLILLSSHPGLKGERGAEQRKQRVASDLQWARRFRHDSWDDTLKAWDRQPVFQGDLPWGSLRKRALPEQASFWLTEFSLGKQDDFRPWLLQTPFPWMSFVGEKDSKFSKLWIESKDFKTRSEQVTPVAGAGHRILCQLSHFPFEKVQKFINLCYC